ncbi:MAG: hypothetical protein WBC05_18990 [Sedimentisphaerales bacterium]
MKDEVKTEDARNLLKRCQEDPLFFSKHVLGGEQPWQKQIQIIKSVRDNTRTMVPSGFGVGKTWVAARTVLWFLFSHPNSLVITTAPTWRQVENVLWAEIRRQHQQSSKPLGGEVLRTQIKVDNDWFALGLSTDEPARFQGFHSANLLLVFDEAAGIGRSIWDVAEGQMAGAFARWLAIGNPIAPSGPFYDAVNNPEWKTIRISCLDCPNVKAGKIIYPKLVTSRWVEDRRKDWGEQSPLYQTKVLGQFPTTSEHGLIPLDWLLAAQERLANNVAVNPDEKRIGVDVARSGDDATVFLLRESAAVRDIEEYHNQNTMETVGKLILFVDKHKVSWNNVFVDVIGIGAGVVDRLKEQRRRVRAVNFGSSAYDSKKYANMRAECYWKVHDALKPDAAVPMTLPARCDKLVSELAAIEWRVTSTGKIIVEPKEDIKKRLGRSPDHADALALSYARPSRKGHVCVC